MQLTTRLLQIQKPIQCDSQQRHDLSEGGHTRRILERSYDQPRRRFRLIFKILY